MNKRNGFTLIETMLAVSILSILMAIFAIFLEGVHRTAVLEDTQMAAHDDVRLGMTRVRRELRMAAASSIVWNGELRTDVLEYQVPFDIDGNGTQLDLNGVVELSDTRWFFRDINDVNEDGIAGTQLLWNDGETTRVLAGHLMENEDKNNNGVLDSGEDLNGNGVLDRGLMFEKVGKSIRVTMQAERKGSPQTPAMRSSLEQLVTPRN